MLAVKYRGPNVPFCLETTVIPTAIGENEVIVQLMAASLCHTELHFADGTLNLGVNDITMGHEAAGVITAVGKDVDPQRIGERVVVYYYNGCGVCRFCASGDEQLCASVKGQHGFTTDGALAGYLKTTSRQAMLLPASISFEKGCTIGCGVTTAVHASRMANIKEGEWVAIYGANGVGFNLIQYVKKRYQAKVIAICRSSLKRDKALLLGTDAAVVDFGYCTTSTLNVIISTLNDTTGLTPPLPSPCFSSLLPSLPPCPPSLLLLPPSPSLPRCRCCRGCLHSFHPLHREQQQQQQHLLCCLPNTCNHQR